MDSKVIAAIDSERAYQEMKWPGHKHTTAEWLLIMQKCLDDAKRAWVCGHGDDSALHEIRQVVATGVAAMEQCGALHRFKGTTSPSSFAEVAPQKKWSEES